MSKDQNQNKKLKVENVENLKFSCKVINEIIMGIKYWKFDQIWPINLYSKSLEKVDEMLNHIIFNFDIDSKIK